MLKLTDAEARELLDFILEEDCDENQLVDNNRWSGLIYLGAERSESCLYDNWKSYIELFKYEDQLHGLAWRSGGDFEPGGFEYWGLVEPYHYTFYKFKIKE